jgi:tRNA A-37 threonylcarbamoyl transferase component Bud32
LSRAWAEFLGVQPAEFLRRVPGREAFLWAGAAGTALVVKRVHEPFALGLRSPGAVEYENLRGLERDGIPVPRALGWSARREGPLGLVRRSVVAMERVEHSQTLRQRLSGATLAERGVLGEQLLALVVRLHQAGWYHRDLYLQHLVLRGGELVLLDVGRARRGRAVRARWFQKDLAALLHSCPRSVSMGERLRFLARYLEARGITQRRAWLRAIVRRERRMARHAPRHGETQPWEDR